MNTASEHHPTAAQTRHPFRHPAASSYSRAFITLRRRLTCLYAVTTSLILTFVMAAFLLMRIRETHQNHLEDFYDLWNTLQFRIQSDTTISQSYLAQTEAAHSAIIHIEDNGNALLYPGSWTPRTDRAALIDRVKALAEEEHVSTSVKPVSSSSITSSLFSFKGDANDSYRGRVMVQVYGKSVRALCLICYVPPLTRTLRETFLLLLILELLGIAGLTVISWQFVGWSLRPVEESRRKQAEFVAAASHELRSPLAVLRSGAAAMRAILCNPKMQPPDPGSNPTAPRSADAPDSAAAGSAPAISPDTILSTFDNECARMSRLIDDMLLLASADAKSWKLQLSDVDMDTLLIEAYDAYEPVCRQRDISLQLFLPQEPLPRLSGDAERIRQVLAILLDNAITYTPSGRGIRVRAELPRSRTGFLTISVADQGPGIPDDAKSRVFDRFYRADSARSDKSHFGLGLSIAWELVHLHGGSIEASDAACFDRDNGSCFTVRLPLTRGA